MTATVATITVVSLLGIRRRVRRVDAVPVEGADRDHDHHGDQGGHRDRGDHVAEADDEDQQEDAGEEGRDAGYGRPRPSR